MKRWIILIAAVVMAVGLAIAYSTSNYMEQGGARWVVGGQLDVVSGGELDVESGGALKIAGTQVTASATELNLLDGLTIANYEVVSEETKDTLINANYDSSTVIVITVLGDTTAFARARMLNGNDDSILVEFFDEQGHTKHVDRYSAFIKE